MKEFRIFIIEDDEVIFKAIKKYLESWNFIVSGVKDFENVFDEFINFKADLLLIDISLPFFNGYHWCEKIRSVSKIPIIFISSASINLNKIMAMNMGADDYITKPFDLDLLVAKIKALLRRTYEYVEVYDNLIYQDLSLDREKMTLKFNEYEIALSKNEFMILEMMFKSPRKVFKREEFMDKIWQTDEFIDDNTLTVNIMRLRKKLEEIGLRNLIKTKKKVGYYLERSE
ncbi:response regulator transcription factor [Anaerococcus sp. Marseille-P3625]|uniref:response regulator transcription factor n=1 Tax=Anaerococcus sp. Marseille-P3625 TaxID=1977277 RepID=UPI000C087139|nr:response regulator transcription factor [Anaerococcus sp. Marseille-P3625]